jgi:TP901 family phage tail tape measure protein
VSVVANVAINVDSRDAVSKLRQVESQAATAERAFGALQSALGALGVGFALTKVIADVKELDTNIRRLATVGVDVAKINPALSSLSKELGGVASKAELAAASYQAASAGFSDTAGNVNILRAATKAAVGGLADTQAVTEVLVKTLNSYGMSGSQAIQVTDSISKAVELGNQEWSDYTSQLGRVASMAALAGVSLDETNAFIASATKNGATAEVAFTGLSAVLTQLLQPTKESQEAAAKLGVQWNLMGLQTKGLGGLMEELAVAIDKDKEAAARMVGPTEAMRGAFAAASKNGSDFKNILEQIGNASGKTDADFQTMKVSLENALKALDTAFKNLSEALGKAFGRAVVSTIEDVTDTVNAFADAINAVPQPVAAAIAEIVKIVAQMILLQKAIQGIIALRAGFVAAMTGMAATTAATGTAATTSSSAFALYTANTRTLQAAAATATPTLVGLRGVLASLASIGTIAIAVNIAVYGIQAVMQARAELDRLRGVRQAGGAAATFGGSAPAASKESARKTLAAIEAERKKNLPMQAIGAISGFGRGLGNTREQVLAERERFARGVLALPTRTAQTPALNAINTPVGATVGGGSNGRKGKTDAEKAAEKAAREAEKLRQELERSLEVGDQLVTQFSRQAALLFEGSEIERKRLQIQFDFQDRAKQIAELKNAEQRTNLNQLNAEIQRLEIIQLQTEELKKQAEEAEKLFKQAMEGAEFGVAGQGTVASGLSDAIAKLKEDLNPIKLQIDAIVNGANAIGSAFGQAFQDVATGAKSTQEALADAFESIGKAFVSMAAEIIAKQMTLIILQTILSALSAGGSALGTANKNLTGAGALKTPLPGLKVGGYAEGGLVTSPTLAMIGEGGEPEYVIPFSKMDAAMANYADGARNQDIFGPLRSASVPFAKTPERLMTERSERETVAAINNPKPLDVRFESQVINGVEYVTAEQHRKGMSQAAERGRALTLAALQNSVKTRKRVGMT